MERRKILLSSDPPSNSFILAPEWLIEAQRFKGTQPCFGHCHRDYIDTKTFIIIQKQNRIDLVTKPVIFVCADVCVRIGILFRLSRGAMHCFCGLRWSCGRLNWRMGTGTLRGSGTVGFGRRVRLKIA